MKHLKQRGGRLAALTLALAHAGLLSTAAQAAEGLSYRYSGYGTLAATRMGADQGEAFRNSVRQHKGAGDELDFGVDSRLGLQGQLLYGDSFTLTGQVLASRRDGADPDLALEWLYAQWSPTRAVDLRLGRVVLPSFIASDTRNVGYAQPWIRTPHDVYGLNAVTVLDGAQALWRLPVGDGVVTLQSVFGSAPDLEVFTATKVKVNFGNIAAATAAWEQGDWLLRLSYQQDKSVSTVTLKTPGGSLVKSAENSNSFTSLGLQYDNGVALLMTERVRRTQTGAASVDAWYVTGGWRFGDWMPSLTHSEMRPNGAGLFPASVTNSAGLRWDAYKNVAVKADWESVEGRNRVLMNVPAANLNKTKYTVLTLGVDFVF